VELVERLISSRFKPRVAEQRAAIEALNGPGGLHARL